jgi:uncharacterized protein (TIGR02596 family)
MNVQPPRRHAAGFTLLELALVVAIAAVLVTMTTFSFQRSLGAQQLNAAAFRLSGDIAQAAQIASTESRTVSLTFIEEHDPLAGLGRTHQFRGWQLQAANPLTGVLEPVADPVRLEAGVILMSHNVFSNILARPRDSGEPCVIRFKADGSTDLPSADNESWCLTLAQEVDVELDAQALPPTSRTVVVNAHTAAVTVY